MRIIGGGRVLLDQCPSCWNGYKNTGEVFTTTKGLYGTEYLTVFKCHCFIGERSGVKWPTWGRRFMGAYTKLKRSEPFKANP